MLLIAQEYSELFGNEHTCIYRYIKNFYYHNMCCWSADAVSMVIDVLVCFLTLTEGYKSKFGPGYGLRLQWRQGRQRTVSDFGMTEIIALLLDTVWKQGTDAAPKLCRETNHLVEGTLGQNPSSPS